jgi:GntR family transcriptional regulator
MVSRDSQLGQTRAAIRRHGADPRLDNDTPIYVQLITHFRQQIETGKWPVNQTIPVLEDLAAEFKVARGTIRQAIGFLQREGLIASRRGRGTLVVRKPEHNIWLPLPNSWADLVKSADSIEGEALDLAAPIRLPVPPETANSVLAPSYFVMRRLLRRDGIPYLVGTSYVDRRIMAEVGANHRDTLSIYRILERSLRSRPSSGEQTLTLGTADAEVAYLLQIPLNSAIVCVLRWVLDQSGTLIYQSEGLFRSDFVQAHRRLK